MIQEKLDGLIKEVMKEKNQDALRTYRAIKTSFMEFKTAKNAKPLDDIAEINIIRKMIAERKSAIEEYKIANRNDLVEIESTEIKYLETFLPEEVSEEEIEKFAQSIITEKGMQSMGKYMRILKEKYPTADGKILSTIVKKYV